MPWHGSLCAAAALTCVALLLSVSGLHAQTTDTRRAKTNGVTVSVETDLAANAGYEAVWNGNIVGDGTVLSYGKTAVRLSVPVHSDAHWRWSVGGYYTYHHAEYSGMGDSGAAIPIDMGTDHHTAGLRVNGFYMDRLFGKPLTAFAYIMADGHEHGLGKVSGFVVGMLQLSRTARSSFGVGLIGLINTTSPWPVFPMLTYRYRFSNRWQMEIMPPQVNFTCVFDQDNRLTAGLTISGDRFYVNPRSRFLPKTCLYSQSMIRPELKYETRLGKDISLCVRHGGQHVMSSRLYGKNSNTKFVDFDTDVSAFWSIQLATNIL